LIEQSRASWNLILLKIKRLPKTARPKIFNQIKNPQMFGWIRNRSQIFDLIKIHRIKNPWIFNCKIFSWIGSL